MARARGTPSIWMLNWLLIHSATSEATWKSAWFLSSTSVIFPSLMKGLKKSSSNREPA